MKKNEILNIIRRKFLLPSEQNREDLLNLIKKAFEYFPSDIEAMNPFLGEINKQDNFLNDFDQIPFTPKNRDEVLKSALSSILGQIRWHSPATMHNINSPMLLDSIAITTIVNLYNPNMIWDFLSANIHEIERKIVKQLANLIGWDNNYCGTFTFGGKGCLIYAIRTGLNRCLPNVSSKGLTAYKKSPVVITSEYNHYIIESVTSLLGLGQNACLRVRTNNDEKLNLTEFAKTLENVVKNDIPIACIILSGGNTLHITIDPIEEAIRIVDNICQKYKLSYRPFIYLDAVVGWPWLFFKDYNFEKNCLSFNSESLLKIKKAYSSISKILNVDALGLDFHKIGFCPYPASLFISHYGNELRSINRDSIIDEELKSYGNNFFQHFTLEHSRSGSSILATWVMLQNIGIEGFQAYLGYLTEVGDVFRKILTKNTYELLNDFAVGFTSVYCPIKSFENYTYDLLLNASENEIEIYNQYVFNLFQFIENKNGKNEDKILLRHLVKYRQAKCGKWPSVIVIYPISIHNNIELAEVQAKIICKRKTIFDKNYTLNLNALEIPESIHK